MDLKVTHSLYLCSEFVSQSSSVFSAIFAEVTGIHDCFILANSLSDAVSLIYAHLNSRFDKSFIDSVLLEVKFVKRLDVVSYE